MPRLSTLSIRLAFLYLIVGFTFGGLMLANKGVELSPYIWALLPAHMEFLLIGWMVQFAFGVAYWIFPRIRGRYRGNIWIAWSSFVLLNLGVVLVSIRVFLPFEDTLYFSGRAAEVGAATTFALHAWNRIKPARA